MKILRDFFWFCSGAHTKLLLKCPTEASKFVGIGATVFFTGVLAAISAGYAISTVFGSIYISVAFGILWGCMIFNLDRYIVCSMKKRNNFWQELKVAAPRLVLAILLALVISKPLELEIFEKEINRKLDAKKSEETIKAKEAIGKGYPEIEELQKNVINLKQEIAQKEAFRNKLQTEYDAERFGKKTDATTGIAGFGKNAKKKEQQLAEANLDLNNTKERNIKKIDKSEIEIQQYNNRKSQTFDLQKPNIDHYDGLAARIEALSSLDNESKAINLANIFIILLFISMETSPILVKLISSKGPYDDLLEMHENTIEKYATEQIAKQNQKTKERIKFALETGDFAIQESITKENTINKQKNDTEMAVGLQKIDHWRELELEKMKNGKVKRENKV